MAHAFCLFMVFIHRQVVPPAYFVGDVHVSEMSDPALWCGGSHELDYNGYKENDLFDRIDFAVLDRTPAQFNYKQFKRNFGV